MAKRELRWSWLANRRVMTKIAVTFGSLLLLFAVTCGLFFVSQQRTEDARRWTAAMALATTAASSAFGSPSLVASVSAVSVRASAS